MALSKFLADRMQIGTGGFSKVYEFDSNYVVKVPYDDKTNAFRSLSWRRKQSRFVHSWTNVLCEKIGRQILPVIYDNENGLLFQRRFEGKLFLTDHKIDMQAHCKAGKIINLACDIMKSITGDDSFIDTGTHNFSFDDDGTVLDWFDPICPPLDFFDEK